MNLTQWQKFNNPVLGNASSVYLVSGEKLTVCKCSIASAMSVKEHDHENEQIVYVLKGKMAIQLGNERRILAAGDVCVIPSNAAHAVDILETPFESLDIFSPIRRDFIKQIAVSGK